MLHYFSIYSSNSSTLIQSRSRPTNFFRQFIQMNKQSKPVDRVKEDNYNAYTFASLGIYQRQFDGQLGGIIHCANSAVRHEILSYVNKQYLAFIFLEGYFQLHVFVFPSILLALEW